MRHHSHVSAIAAAVSGILSAVAAASANAQAGPSAAGADSGRIEEIVVTSRRVAENLQETPLAVSAFRSEDIERLNVRNVGDVAAFTPNFISNPGPTGGNDGFFFIRGVGQTDLNPATDPGVATYIDGVYLGRVMGASMDTGDVERIEILRGPQGTLFGRNTIGGAVSVVTRDPAKEFSTQLMAGFGSRDLINARGAIDVPLGDTAGLLASVSYREQDGWGERADGEIFDTNESLSGRVKFKWVPSDTLSLTLSGDMTDLTGTSQHTILSAVNPAIAANFGRSCVPLFPGYGPPSVCSPLLVPLPADLGQFVNTIDGRPYRNQTSIAPDKDYDAAGASLIVDWDLGGVALKSITAYRDLSQDITTDYDSSPYAFYEGGFITDQDQLSQELQLTGEHGRFRWLLGAFYYEEDNDHTNLVSLGGNNGCLPPGVPSFGFPWPACAPGQAYATVGVNRRIINNQRIALDVEAKAVFAQTTVRLTDAWSATLGLRWTDEEKDQSYDFFIDNSAAVANQAGLPPAVFPTLSPDNPNVGVPTRYRKSWDDFTPRLGVEYKPVEDLLFYVSYAEGFKSGGFNGRPTPGSNGQFAPIEPYDPEEIDTWELGAKTQFADDRVRLNAAVFQSDYQGIQLLRVGSSGFFETVNAAESRIRGAELELLARPLPELDLQASLGYTDNEYQELDPGVIAIGIGFDDQLPLTPDWSASLGAEYTWPTSVGALSFRTDVLYRSEMWFEATNTDINRQGRYTLLNLRATWRAPDERWSVAAYGLNVTDEVYYTNVQDVTGALGVAFASVSAPREWGVELRYSFGP